MQSFISYNKVQRWDCISSRHPDGTQSEQPTNLARSATNPANSSQKCCCPYKYPNRSVTEQINCLVSQAIVTSNPACQTSPRMMPTAMKPTARLRNKQLQYNRAFLNCTNVLNGSLKRHYHLYADGGTQTLPDKLVHVTRVT